MKKKIIYFNENNKPKTKESNYLDNITRLLVLFQTRKYITKEEIIEELAISERTFYRYLKKLEKAGVPIRYNENNNCQLTIDEGKTALRLDKIAFTDNETIAFIIAGNLVENYSDYSVSVHYRNAMSKILAALKYASKKDFLELITKNTTSLKKEVFNRKRFPHHFLIEIQKAIANQQTLQIQYYTYHKDEITGRELIPIEINFYRSMWHIRAFCKLKNDYREFRLDRIEELSVTTNIFDKNEYTIEKYLASKKISTPEKRITIVFNKKIERLIYQSKFNFNILKETEFDDKIEIIFGIDKYKYPEFLPWLLMWGKECEIIKPKYIKKEIKKIVRELVEHY